MEINIVSRKDKTAVIELTDVSETIIYSLVDRMMDDKDIRLAAYKTGHPQLDKPTLTVKSERVNPETALKKAAVSLAEDVENLKKGFEKSIKKPAPKKQAAKTVRSKKKKELPKTKKTAVKSKKKKETKAKKDGAKSGKSTK